MFLESALNKFVEYLLYHIAMCQTLVPVSEESFDTGPKDRQMADDFPTWMR